MPTRFSLQRRPDKFLQPKYRPNIISTSLSVSIVSGVLILRTCRLDHLCVCVCVRKVYCGKTADWLWMPFGVMSGVGFGMGVLDGGGNCRRGRGSFVGEFGASHCNQWGLCDALFSNYFEDLLVLFLTMLS